MRVSDDRYNKDRLRFDLALRMVRYGARARTIRTWTGLSNDRLRKLCRAYMLPRPQRSTRRLQAASGLRVSTVARHQPEAPTGRPASERCSSPRARSARPDLVSGRCRWAQLRRLTTIQPVCHWIRSIPRSWRICAARDASLLRWGCLRIGARGRSGPSARC